MTFLTIIFFLYFMVLPLPCMSQIVPLRLPPFDLGRRRHTLGLATRAPSFLSAGGLGDCVSCGAFILFIAVINSVLGPNLDLSVLFKSVDIRAASSSGACGGCKPSACPSPPTASAGRLTGLIKRGDGARARARAQERSCTAPCPPAPRSSP